MVGGIQKHPNERRNNKMFPVTFSRNDEQRDIQNDAQKTHRKAGEIIEYHRKAGYTACDNSIGI